MHQFQIPLLLITGMVKQKTKIAVNLLDFYLASRALSELGEYVSRRGPLRIMCQNLFRLNPASWAEAPVLHSLIARRRTVHRFVQSIIKGWTRVQRYPAFSVTLVPMSLL